MATKKPRERWQPERTELLTVRVSAAMMKRLQQAAAGRDTTMSQLIRDGINSGRLWADSPGDMLHSAVHDPLAARTTVVQRGEPELPFTEVKPRPRKRSVPPASTG